MVTQDWLTIWTRPKEGTSREWRAIGKVSGSSPHDLQEVFRHQRADHEYAVTSGQPPSDEPRE
jgi:hypothetical protein